MPHISGRLRPMAIHDPSSVERTKASTIIARGPRYGMLMGRVSGLLTVKINSAVRTGCSLRVVSIHWPPYPDGSITRLATGYRFRTRHRIGVAANISTEGLVAVFLPQYIPPRKSIAAASISDRPARPWSLKRKTSEPESHIYMHLHAKRGGEATRRDRERQRKREWLRRTAKSAVKAAAIQAAA